MQPHHTTNEIPYGYCHCGCGQKTTIPTKTNRKIGRFKGQPMRFIMGHHPRLSPHDRFWQYVTPGLPGDCWEWQGNRMSKGYGRLCINRISILAHRLSYELHNGPVLEGLEVCHSCDNPACVNPAHLWLGTHADNMRDRDAKDRCHPGGTCGEAHGNSKLKEQDIIEIRKLREQGLLQREIASLFDVSQHTVSAILLGNAWRHVP